MNVKEMSLPIPKNGKPMTNEEWLHTLNTEHLAEWIAHQTMIALLENQNNHSLRMTYPAYWVEWLKKPHRGENEK